MKTHRCARAGCKKDCPVKNKFCSQECLLTAREATKAPLPKCARAECANTVKDRDRTYCSAACASLAARSADTSTVEGDRAARKSASETTVLKRKYAEALQEIEAKDAQLELLRTMDAGLDTFVIEPKLGSGTSEGMVCMPASDWHSEEIVGGEMGGLNDYNPDIAKASASNFFSAGLRLIRLLQQDIKIPTLSLPLLGDFITGQIHGAENAEKNAMPPAEAIMFVLGMLKSGYDFLLNHSELEIVSHCHSGNHGRTTQTTRFASENGHSLEYLMYHHLAAHYRNEPRVKFIIPEGMHSYMEVYGQTIRFHHGHAVKYGGGVGGIYIPVNKAIAQWNKARTADLDVFGHFHQMRDGGNFICNGSLIGYNSFALSIKADYEQPKQALFLMDKKRGRTCTWPILVR